MPNRRPTKLEVKPRPVPKLMGVEVSLYEAEAPERCNFRVIEEGAPNDLTACGEWAATHIVFTDHDNNEQTVVARLCRRHASRLAISLVEDLA